ncbi:MAG: glycosyltransferase [Cyanobacteria bacterium P01_D01_bin.105]
MALFPSFSIIIPAYNRPERLSNCLQALCQLHYPRDRFEVVIVDDGSPTPLESVVHPFRTALTLTFIRQPNAGPATARNTGAAAAKSEYLAFTDDDCMPSPNWLSGFATELAKESNAMVGGRSLNALPRNPYSTASQALIDYLYAYYNNPHKEMFFASNNIAMSQKNYLKVGGFNTSFPLAAAEDRELCDRWHQNDLPMRYAPSVTIRHAHHLSLKSFWRQHFGYGRGAFCFHQVRSQRNRKPIKVEPVKFYTDLFIYPLSRKDVKFPWIVSILFFLSQLATTTGFLWERSFHKKAA